MTKKILLIAFITGFAAVGFVFADSISLSEDMESMYTDHKAYKVGDIVTIFVMESTQGSQSASLKTQKKAGISGTMGVSSWGGVTFDYPAWSASGKEEQDGGGKSIRSGSLMGTISARVDKVLSNGNLIIKGSKVIQINDDKQNLIIKGVVRPEDITSENTISSMFVADADIQYEGKGPIGEKTSPGIITRFFDWLGLF